MSRNLVVFDGTTVDLGDVYRLSKCTYDNWPAIKVVYNNGYVEYHYYDVGYDPSVKRDIEFNKAYSRM